MKKLLIIGARQYGRVVYNIAVDCIAHGADFQIKGFLDNNPNVLDNFENYPPIISSVEDYEVQKEDVFICALSDNNYKKEYSEKILSKGGEFINIISPRSYIQMNVNFGKGCVIGYDSAIACDTKIGDFVTILGNTSIGHDVVIGNWSHIGGSVFIGGGVEIGEGATLQTGVRVIPHKKIGDYAYLGIGSICMKSVKPNTKVFGYPAKKIDL